MEGARSQPGRGRYAPERDPIPTVKKTGWVPGPVWTGAKNLAPTGTRPPNRPARSESLYRLSYPGPPDCIQGGEFLDYMSDNQLHIKFSTPQCYFFQIGMEKGAEKVNGLYNAPVNLMREY